jgi:hypothetical protein
MPKCQYLYFCTSKASKVSTSSTKSRTTSSQRNWVYESVGFSLCRICQHMSAYVPSAYIRQPRNWVYESVGFSLCRIPQHMSAYVPSAYVSLGTGCMKASASRCVAYLSICQHTYRQHTSAYASIRQPRNLSLRLKPHPEHT